MIKLTIMATIRFVNKRAEKLSALCKSIFCDLRSFKT